MYSNARTSFGAGVEQVAQIATVPASSGGVNQLDAMMRMPSEDCLYAYNMMPAERGMRLRKGYREWATGCGTGEVRTILGYEAQGGTGSQERLWAVTNEGIYNVTTYGTTSPTQDVSFSTTTGLAGFGVKCEFTNDASDHFMFYADAVNGIHQYKEGTGWSVPTGWSYDPTGSGTPIDFPVEDVCFVMVHKLRIWVILEDSDDAWYLPVASIAGQLQKFTFGAKMQYGGDLMGLWSWTVDGGAGVDDLMVGIGRGGDLFVYQGNDPSLDDFGLIGAWFIGTVPNSRRLVAAHGSEMYALSSFGITSLRDLMQGAASSDLRNSPSAKINLNLRAAVEADISETEWSLNIHPADGFMQVVTPDPGSDPYVQYNQNLSTKAWGMWKDVPMISGGDWDGEYYIGGASGVVYQYEGTLDATTLSTDGEPVEYELLTSFQAQIAHSTYKRVGFVRTLMIGTLGESYTATVVYDYNENQMLPHTGSAAASGAAIWDTDTWDGSIWDYVVNGVSEVEGSMGIGRVFGIGLKGNSSARIELIGFDVTFDNGGFL